MENEVEDYVARGIQHRAKSYALPSSTLDLECTTDISGVRLTGSETLGGSITIRLHQQKSLAVSTTAGLFARI